MADLLQSELIVSGPFLLPGGATVVIRPIRAEDEAMMNRFHNSLSPESVYNRFFGIFKLRERASHVRLEHVCHPDPRIETVLVVEKPSIEGGDSQIIGVASLRELQPLGIGELAVTVSDPWQRQGIGTELVRRLIRVAHARKLDRVCAHILRTNVAMQRACVAADMHIIDAMDDNEVKAVFDFNTW